MQKGRPFVYLALSGGGGGGAFGAGVLNGWSESGTRPEFTIVSGVSTGALIAPFAFLGPDYDDRLRQVYTNGEAQRLIGQPNPLGALFGPGVFGRERLRRLVERYLDDDLIRAIAREDQKGRRLLVVTTNLDAQRAVVWDMGAIATSGDPKAFDLFRDVLAASASVPVVFAPQLINVESDNKVFQEMHADGTLSAPVYTLPDAVLFGGKPILRAARPALYVIVNGRIDPGFAVVPDQVEAIAAQSLSTLNRVGAKAVLAQTYNVAKPRGYEFSLELYRPRSPRQRRHGFRNRRDAQALRLRLREGSLRRLLGDRSIADRGGEGRGEGGRGVDSFARGARQLDGIRRASNLRRDTRSSRDVSRLAMNWLSPPEFRLDNVHAKSSRQRKGPDR